MLIRWSKATIAFPDWQASFVDGAGGKSVTDRMWQRMRPLVDGSIIVTLDQTCDAMRLIAEKSRTIAEGAGALSLAAALAGKAGRSDRLRRLGRQHRPREVCRVGGRLKASHQQQDQDDNQDEAQEPDGP